MSYGLTTPDDMAEHIKKLEKACREWSEVSQKNYQRAKAAEAKLAAAEQKGYANAMEAERKIHEERIEELEDEVEYLQGVLQIYKKQVDDLQKIIYDMKEEDLEHKFAIIVTSKKALTQSNTAITLEDDKFWVTDDPEGWVVATSVSVDLYKDNLPIHLKVFNNKESAARFASTWQGHPWWCIPKDFEIVEVVKKKKVERDGYRIK